MAEANNSVKTMFEIADALKLIRKRILKYAAKGIIVEGRLDMSNTRLMEVPSTSTVGWEKWVDLGVNILPSF